MASSSDFVDVSKPDPGALTMATTPGAFGRQASAEFRRHLMFLHSMPLVVHLGNQKFQSVAQLDTQGEARRLIVISTDYCVVYDLP
jgi:hypothetical protein